MGKNSEALIWGRYCIPNADPLMPAEPGRAVPVIQCSDRSAPPLCLTYESKQTNKKKDKLFLLKPNYNTITSFFLFFQLCIIFRQTEDVHLFTKTNKKLLKQKFKLDRNIYIFNIKYLDI